RPRLLLQNRARRETVVRSRAFPRSLPRARKDPTRLHRLTRHGPRLRLARPRARGAFGVSAPPGRRTDRVQLPAYHSALCVSWSKFTCKVNFTARDSSISTQFY